MDDDTNSMKSKYKIASGLIKNNRSYPLPTVIPKKYVGESNFDSDFHKNMMGGQNRDI